MSSGQHTLSDIHPCLTYDDALVAIDWLCSTFGFIKRLVVPGENGSVMHSELSLGTGVVMVSSPRPEAKRLGPRSSGGAVSTLSVYVANPDEHFANAVAAGAHIVRPIQDEEYGARGYSVEDIEGHQWYFGNYRPGQYWEMEPSAS